MFVCPFVQVTLVAIKPLAQLFIITFNQYTYIIIRCCITTICSDGSTVILRRVPIWIITWPRLTEYWYFSTQTPPLFIKSHAESLCAHLKWHRHSTTGSFFLLFSSDKMHLFREFCCLEIKDTTDTPRSASYLDSSRNWQQGKTFYEAVWQTRWLHISHREFPFFCGNIPAAPAYRVYISQLVHYSIASGVYRDFLDRVRLLTDKLMRQGYVAKRLKSSLLNLYGRHHDLVDRYETTVLQMQIDVFPWSASFFLCTGFDSGYHGGCP
jgi:hypothetical protein